jgi:uncharacterized damage-inducible protein DinB
MIMSTLSAQSTATTITSQFDLHTRLFRNVLEGITDDAAATQHSPNANHIKFLAGHLVHTRLMLVGYVGLPGDDRFSQFDKNIAPRATYLPMAEILAKWDEIAGPISAGISKMSAEDWAGTAPFPTPTGTTMADFLAFLMHHEAYHIGQLGILRKFAGKEAMKY